MYIYTLSAETKCYIYSNLTQAQDITATQLGTQRITAVQTKTPLATPTLISEQAITAGPIKPISPCYTYTSTVPYTGPSKLIVFLS